MAGPTDANFKCTLDDKSLEKAIKELNEDPKNRLGAVETFRQWVKQQKHLSCPTDINFLLPFLRVRYFSQLEARKLLDSYMTRRAKCPHWFRNIDPTEPGIDALLNDGVFFILPNKDDEGRTIVMFRYGRFNTKSKVYTKVDLARMFCCVMEAMYVSDEVTNVNGTVHLMDFAGYTMAHQTLMTMDEQKDLMAMWQGSYPARVKQLHFFNSGGMLELIMSLMRIVMPEKFKERLKVHGQVLEDLYRDVPQRLLPLDYLPDDYDGPHAGTEKELIEYTKNYFMSHRERIKYLTQGKWGVDEVRRPTGAESVPNASFRKLALDD